MQESLHVESEIEVARIGTKLSKESNGFDMHECIENGHENGPSPKLKTSHDTLLF